MFLFKKIAGVFLFPPGIFVTLLLCSSAWLFSRRNAKAASVNLFLGCLLWLFSTSPVADTMLRGLEYESAIPQSPKGDVIILLGGGAYDNVPDLSGAGSPSEEMMGRLITAARLQKRLNIPIIVSGGKVFKEREAEAPIVKRFLVDLGVPAGMIITEEKSRDTMENARNTVEICTRLGYHQPLLVTSAYHMRRAVLSFRKTGWEVVPFPADFRAIPGRRYGWQDYVPVMSDLKNSSLAMKEYAGLIFYRLVY
ncbi:MAG: YdcF family protein [Nitrospirae bacterium]|nr:YdcF family protein [Nitrospirota bacterium]MCL5421847.1 YdcF family protein [Nitrospirota bacterium]